MPNVTIRIPDNVLLRLDTTVAASASRSGCGSPSRTSTIIRAITDLCDRLDAAEAEYKATRRPLRDVGLPVHVQVTPTNQQPVSGLLDALDLGGTNG